MNFEGGDEVDEIKDETADDMLLENCRNVDYESLFLH